MGLSEGLYKISTTTHNGPMFVALPPGPAFVGSPVLGGPEPWMAVINVKPVGGDRYAFCLWYHRGLNAGFNENNPEPGAGVFVTRNQDQFWAVDPGNEGDWYRIHVPDQNLYWSVPPGAQDSIPVTMQPLQGIPTQQWKFELLHAE